jgi:hypothetical protein
MATSEAEQQLRSGAADKQIPCRQSKRKPEQLLSVLSTGSGTPGVKTNTQRNKHRSQNSTPTCDGSACLRRHTATPGKRHNNATGAASTAHQAQLPKRVSGASDPTSPSSPCNERNTTAAAHPRPETLSISHSIKQMLHTLLLGQRGPVHTHACWERRDTRNLANCPGHVALLAFWAHLELKHIYAVCSSALCPTMQAPASKQATRQPSAPRNPLLAAWP